MNEIAFITSAISAQQGISRSQLGMEIMKSKAQSEQALAQMLMESIRAGQVLVNQAASGRIDLFA